MKTGQAQEDMTPMLAQYHHFKERYKDSLLFFRLGDFYELFYQDAVVGSRELGLVLTSRPAGKGRERIPMCGVPYHSAHNYIQRLISKGYRVAICEQVEPAERGRGIVRRDVIRVITPGTFFERSSLGFGCIYKRGDLWLVSVLNLAVGEFIGAVARGSEVYDFLSKFNLGEVLLRKGEPVDRRRLEGIGLHITELEEEFFEDGARELTAFLGGIRLRALGFEEEDLIYPLGASYLYARFTQKEFTPFIGRPRPFIDEGFVRLDFKAVRGLELIEGSEGRKDLSLFGVIDRTLTGMGRRRLRFHILNPFRSTAKIRRVQEAVEFLVRDPAKRERIREILQGMGDLERLVSRISGGMASPREVVQLKNALYRAVLLRKELEGCPELLSELGARITDLLPLAEEIDRVLVDDPPVHLKEGGLIKEGVSEDLDNFRRLRDNAGVLLKDYEERLRRETGINSLKIGYNRMIGYYIEVTRPNLRFVPPSFRRRQTLTNAERFITDELSDLEEKILSAQSRIEDLEYEIYVRLRERILSQVEEIGSSAGAVGEIDYIQSLAQIADSKGWVRPEITDSLELHIEEGRHPVIEEFTESFVPNSTELNENVRVNIITGPNMAGKSSYIRQVAVIVLLAHMGSFVPAKRARIGWVDGIFTRIGSGDVLALGVSTFMNEMLDVSALMNLATERSLIILDEIGRGTSTYDGIALSRAILEYVIKEIGARTLVATHFLELTELEKEMKGVKNYHMEVAKTQDGITFLYNLVEGVAESSFGVQVAKMAGIPKEVIRRAEEILKFLEKGTVPEGHGEVKEEIGSPPTSVDKVITEIKSIELSKTTPIEALLKILEWKEELEQI